MTTRIAESPLPFASSGSSPPMPTLAALRHDALTRGVEHLGDHELLGLLVGGHDPLGGALRAAGEDGLIGAANHTIAGLRRMRFTTTAAVTVAAAFEMVKRLAHARRAKRPTLKTPENVAVVVSDLLSSTVEKFLCLSLDPMSRLIRSDVVSVGDIDSTDAGARAFFRTALVAGAATCIAVHNHPSGDPEPSAADCAASRVLVQAGRILNVPLVDHVVIGDGNRFASLRRLHPDIFR